MAGNGRRREIVKPPPLIALPKVHHVGLLDPSAKRTGSYEGAGLSVCLHPSAWRRIARGTVGGTTHALEHPTGLFVDAHAIGRTMRRAILKWAVGRGLAEKARIWTMSWDDSDEDGEDRRSWCVFGDADEAESEAEEYEDQNVEIVEALEHRSTAALEAATMQTEAALGDGAVIDLVLPAWAHEVHGISGVWWDDEHDPWNLSAPRGVIRAEALSEWTIEPIGYDPDDEDCVDGGEEDEPEGREELEGA
jgi:hypothetical protein